MSASILYMLKVGSICYDWTYSIHTKIRLYML